MNMLVVAGMPAMDGGVPVWLMGHSGVISLFALGFAMIVIAGYLLSKAPKFHPIRYLRRR